ncbi:TnsA endonuclease N-terminal domain-containing protein [Parasphingorhabdus sp.]|uniref:TnsA endonuclease N-terminal domain-containing protein n=1 Tax=Parasphingorhabdus sp. TaxID=2709688 RepID=UPI003A8D6166
MIERGIPTSRILINVGDPKITSNDDIREFNRLDYPESEKQFIILVGKGQEGWNCRSLFGVALFRAPKSKVFVLQATMRCLRSIGDVQHTGRIYLSEENESILDDELKQNFRMTADDLKGAGDGKINVEVRVNEPVPTITIQRVRRSFELDEKQLVDGADLGFNKADKNSWAELTDKYRLLQINRKSLDGPKLSDQVTDLTDQREKLQYSKMMLVAEISRYLNRPPLEIETILASTKQGTDKTIEAVNDYNELLHDLIIPRLFNTLFSLNEFVFPEKHEIELVRIPPDGVYNMRVAKDKIERDDSAIAKPFVEKSFHLDTYCFDSNPEQRLFWDLLRQGKVKKLYFTGMLTHGQSDFFVQYIDPDSKAVRSYYPDFLFERDDGKWVIVEVKGDNMIDDPVVKAKQQYAEQMAIASGMEYHMIKGSDADAHSYQSLFQ